MVDLIRRLEDRDADLEGIIGEIRAIDSALLVSLLAELISDNEVTEDEISTDRIPGRKSIIQRIPFIRNRALTVHPASSRSLDALMVAVVLATVGTIVGLLAGFIWAIPLLVLAGWNLIKSLDIIQAFLRIPKDIRAPPLTTPIATNTNGNICLHPAATNLLFYNPVFHERLHTKLSRLPLSLQEFIIHTIDFIGLFNKASEHLVCNNAELAATGWLTAGIGISFSYTFSSASSVWQNGYGFLILGGYCLSYLYLY